MNHHLSYRARPAQTNLERTTIWRDGRIYREDRFGRVSVRTPAQPLPTNNNKKGSA